MGLKKHNSQGFTLVAALLIMVLLSGVAAGILYFVTSETRMGGNDLEQNLAFYDAESGMEKLTSDLAALYQASQVPTNAQIQNLVNFPPTTAMVGPSTYNESITYAQNANGTPISSWNTISSGANQGLYAEIVPMTLQVVATRPAGAQVNMTRQVEVALIPVFQFGVFCGYDCSYFAGPDFSFGGRVHTNMNLFLASGANVVFNDKVQAFKQILTDELENGFPTNTGQYPGTIWIPNSSSGCPLNQFPPVGANCIALPAAIPGDASWSGGYPGQGGAANANFPSISTGTFNGYLSNSLTGATNLQLPFVQNSCVSNPPPCTDPIAIVRKPLAGEAPTSVLGSERLYNKAQIRILIADTLADLHPDRGAGALDAQDYEFPTGAATSYVTAGGTEYFGWATPGTNGWVNPYNNSGLQNWTGTGFPLIGQLTTNPGSVAAMGGATGGPWIRVEYCNAVPCSTPGNWVGVTNEWLGLGFGRFFNNPPTAPGTNAVDTNAILILQQLRPTLAAAAGHGAGTSGNWYPINFYDTREGEMRDNPVNNVTPNSGTAGYPNTYSSCSVNGIMNAVELDVGNLTQWLKGTIGASGPNVVWNQNNGYVLYFSDHRGMLPSTHASNGGQTPAGIPNGESGIEDVVNAAMNLTSSPGTAPDGVLEPASFYSYSPEDVDQNGFLDNWGEKNLGYGFGINTNINPLNPYLRINVTNVGTATSTDCASYNQNTGALLTGITDQMGMANPVSGARHVLKLVDGGMSAAGKSYLPVMPTAASACVQNAGNPTGCGGFTVASENPVYVQGNYNTNGTADTFWGGGAQVPHSAASIIADSVTVLSNSWSDMGSLMWPTTVGNRGTSADAYYRMAVAGGKNIPFPQPGWANVGKDFGTDGGLHNFLRYLETWNNTLHYDGSLVSMYYAEYDTGTFKCCTVVYSPPTRDYYFDVLFLNPNNLPPATPMFQDVVNLSYHQNFTPH